MLIPTGNPYSVVQGLLRALIFCLLYPLLVCLFYNGVDFGVWIKPFFWLASYLPMFKVQLMRVPKLNLSKQC